MDDYYQLIDLESGNVIDDFDTRADAFNFLAKTAGEFGEATIRELSLMRLQGETQELVALQQELVRLVEEHERASLVGHGAQQSARG
jgi:hypothetical protein